MELILKKALKIKIEIRFIIELLNHLKPSSKKMTEKLRTVPN